MSMTNYLLRRAAVVLTTGATVAPSVRAKRARQFIRGTTGGMVRCESDGETRVNDASALAWIEDGFRRPE